MTGRARFKEPGGKWDTWRALGAFEGVLESNKFLVAYCF